MLKTIEINPESPPSASVIWLHGLGASGYDFLDVVPLLNLPPELNIRFVFPHAPVRKVTYTGNTKIRAWFNVVDLKDNMEEDEAGIRESEILICELIAKELAQGIPSNKIVIAGFSQGGVMAVHCGLRYPEKLAGILVLSAWVPLKRTVSSEKNVINQNTPVLMLHGTDDDLVPAAWAKRSYNYLHEIGYNVTLSVYPMRHTVCPEEINTIGSWLRNLLV